MRLERLLDIGFGMICGAEIVDSSTIHLEDYFTPLLLVCCGRVFQNGLVWLGLGHHARKISGPF